jgi:hypothetical protein
VPPGSIVMLPSQLQMVLGHDGEWLRPRFRRSSPLNIWLAPMVRSRRRPFQSPGLEVRVKHSSPNVRLIISTSRLSLVIQQIICGWMPSQASPRRMAIHGACRTYIWSTTFVSSFAAFASILSAGRSGDETIRRRTTAMARPVDIAGQKAIIASPRSMSPGRECGDIGG